MKNDNDRTPPFYQEVCDIVTKDWDPIGVTGMPGAENEYDTAAAHAYVLVQERKSEEEIFDFLWTLETDYMSLSGDLEKTKSIAQRLAGLVEHHY